MSVTVKCRKCGRLADPEKFVLDHFHKMVVCPSCVRERKMQEARAPSAHVAEEPMPVDQDKVKVECKKCGYRFTFNMVKKTPAKCPFCNS